MECKCRICPRDQWKDFIRVCTECSGYGGNVGNVCHYSDCSNIQCFHSDIYDGRELIKKNKEKCKYNCSEEVFGSAVPPAENFFGKCTPRPNHLPSSYGFPPNNIITVHKQLRSGLKLEIKIAMFKLHENLMKKVFDLIEAKTGKRIVF